MVFKVATLNNCFQGGMEGPAIAGALASSCGTPLSMQPHCGTHMGQTAGLRSGSWQPPVADSTACIAKPRITLASRLLY
jgi:hypothetical protein